MGKASDRDSLVGLLDPWWAQGLGLVDPSSPEAGSAAARVSTGQRHLLDTIAAVSTAVAHHSSTTRTDGRLAVRARGDLAGVDRPLTAPATGAATGPAWSRSRPPRHRAQAGWSRWRRHRRSPTGW
jgi:hypothetical protein